MSFFSSFSRVLNKPSKKAVSRSGDGHPKSAHPAGHTASPVPSDFEQQAREIVLAAKDEAIRIKHQAEEESRRLRGELVELEQRLAQKEESLDRKAGSLEERERGLSAQQQELTQKLSDIEKVKEEQLTRLQKIADLSVEEAKQKILAAVEQKSKAEAARLAKSIVDEAKDEAATKAREILVSEIIHGATDYTAEFTVSEVKLPNDEIKGRIIGKEGRNIRSFEQATGVDVELGDENTIRLSSFDGIRREVARIALQRLVADGRIQPARIEEIVGQVRRDIERIMYEEGVKLAQSVGVYNLPRELIEHLGKFKYRFSYGQNMIAHTLEETKIGVAIASEVKADVNVVKLGCLLHDIGKVIDKEEGSHVTLGAELLRKLGMPEKVIACVEEHHEDKPFSSIESMITYLADAISGSRPGARYEDFDKYVQRLSQLEEICKSFNGVTEAWVFQAGRDIRVLVDPGKVNDTDAEVLARDIKDKIEQEVKDFPGQIKVTVIRELRVSQTTR